jgi:membrane protein DedA with SNARE-associated domain
VLFPNNYVCLIAGAARMSPWLFAGLNIAGSAGRLFMIQILGDVFAGPISSVLGFVSTWRVPLLVVSIGLVALTSLGELRRGKREITELEILEHSGEADTADPTEPSI